MQHVHVYLNFPGTTDEALRLYQQVFGTSAHRMVSLTTPA